MWDCTVFICLIISILLYAGYICHWVESLGILIRCPSQFTLYGLWFDTSACSECLLYQFAPAKLLSVYCCVLLNRSIPLTCSTALVDCLFMAGLVSCMRSEELQMITDSLVSQFFYASAQCSVAGGVLFLSCLSVHASVCVHPEILLTRYLAECLTHFHQITIWGQKVKDQDHGAIKYAGNSTFWAC